MTDQEALTKRALAHRLLIDRMKGADAANRALIGESFAVKDRKVAYLPGEYGQDIEVGHVRVDPGSVTPGVTDMQALIDWCEQNAPTEVEEYQPAPVTRVRPAYLTSLLDAAKKQGAAVTTEGEVIPGITVRTSDPRVVVKPAGTVEAEAVLMQAILSDANAVSSLLGEITDGSAADLREQEEQ